MLTKGTKVKITFSLSSRVIAAIAWLFKTGRWHGIIGSHGIFIADRPDMGYNYQIQCKNGIWLVHPKFVEVCD